MKRYSFNIDRITGCYCEIAEKDNGEYVTYDDVITLLKKLVTAARLRARLAVIVRCFAVSIRKVKAGILVDLLAVFYVGRIVGVFVEIGSHAPK